jgi:DNA repair exonuclease SbcCD ATPase subunit
MLNWRRDPGYEQRMNALAIRIQKTRNEAEQIKNEAEQIKKETEQIKRDVERLRQENDRLRRLNLRTQSLLSSADQICFPPECSSIHPTPTDPDSGPSSP